MLKIAYVAKISLCKMNVTFLNKRYWPTCASLKKTGSPVSSKYPYPPKLSKPSDAVETA